MPILPIAVREVMMKVSKVKGNEGMDYV